MLSCGPSGRLAGGCGQLCGVQLPRGDHHLITDTVQRWDAEETSRKVELQVGRDLQFIRINGTVVGALAGLAIHTVSQLLLCRWCARSRPTRRS
jgi:hypothetical protein